MRLRGDGSMGSEKNKNQNHRNWYVQFSKEFQEDRDYKRMCRKLRDIDCTGIYLSLIVMAIEGMNEKTPDPDCIVLQERHDEDSFSEELAYALNRDPDDMKKFLDYAFSCGLIEQRKDDQDLYIIRFPDNAVGSITDSSIRSQISREKKRMLQSNSDATKCNNDAANIIYKDNKSKIQNKSDINIDSNSNINIDSNTFILNNMDDLNTAPATGGTVGAAPEGAPPSAVRPLFALEEVKAQADRRKPENRLSEQELADMYQEFVNNGFMLYRTYADQGEAETQALYHAVNTWIKNHRREVENKWSPDFEPEDIKRLTESEIKKMFPAIVADDPEDYEAGKEVLKDSWAYFDHDDLDDFGNASGNDTDEQWVKDIYNQAREYITPIMGKLEKYLKLKYEDEHLVCKKLSCVDRFEDGEGYQTLIPYFVPKKSLTLEQRRLLFTFLDVQFPADEKYHVLKLPEVLEEIKVQKAEEKRNCAKQTQQIKTDFSNGF